MSEGVGVISALQSGEQVAQRVDLVDTNFKAATVSMLKESK